MAQAPLDRYIAGMGMTRPGGSNAYALGMDMWMLGMESALVIGMRTLKLAAGGAAAERESRDMVIEKLSAAVELPLALATSGATSPEGLARSAVRHYSQKVRANRRRLFGQSAKA